MPDIELSIVVEEGSVDVGLNNVSLRMPVLMLGLLDEFADQHHIHDTVAVPFLVPPRLRGGAISSGPYRERRIQVYDAMQHSMALNES